ncbi:MAG: molybdopterin-dependent oxidoreductase, partial [Pyrinomonadaceae bacterium]|nr:molybdopterin-dependent oxidoreductase [Pyrinomonadaceae bacterium]
GLDEVVRHEKTFGFGGSIPLDKALGDEVLLAFEMNGKPLLPTHGFPIRAVVAGFIGARSVKWLSTITLQTETSDNYFQQHAYKLFPSNINATNVDWTTGAMLGEQSLTSVICSPAKNSKINDKNVTINGFAIAGGGRKIERVEISNDNGATWKTTDLENNKDEKAWAWTFWQTQIELPRGEHEICVRAFDSASNTQPENAANLWNFKGYMNNAWHRVKFEVVE